MLTRRPASLLALVAVVGLAASGCGSTSAAIRVDGESVSQRDFEDQLEFLGDHDALRLAIFGEDATADQVRRENDPRGSFRQYTVGLTATLQVQFLLVPGLLDAEDIEITDADRQDMVAQFEQVDPEALDDMPATMRDQYVDGFAALGALRAELGDDGLGEAVFNAFADADVDISSRYGSWDDLNGRVIPPPGPRPAPGSDDGTGTGAPGSELPAG